MSFRWYLLFILWSTLLLLCSCENKPRKILIYSPEAAASPTDVSARLTDYCVREGIQVDTASSADYLVEDSLVNYNAIAFIRSSPDKLGYRHQNDIERLCRQAAG